MKKFNISIRGDRWCIAVLSPVEFDKHFSSKYLGVTSNKRQRLICFRTDALDLNTVIHELFHAHFTYLCLERAEKLTTHQIEEILAEWMGYNAQSLVRQGLKVYARILKLR